MFEDEESQREFILSSIEELKEVLGIQPEDADDFEYALTHALSEEELDAAIERFAGDKLFQASEVILKKLFDRAMSSPLSVDDAVIEMLNEALNSWYPLYVKSQVGIEYQDLAEEMVSVHMDILGAIISYRSEMKSIADVMTSMTPAIFRMMEG